MSEFKLEEFPESVQQLADFAASVLKMDSGFEWTVTSEVEHWDAQIRVRYEDWGYIIRYEAGQKFTRFLLDLSMVYQLWDRDKKAKAEAENVIK